jgi:hypothetical protein
VVVCLVDQALATPQCTRLRIQLSATHRPVFTVLYAFRPPTTHHTPRTQHSTHHSPPTTNHPLRNPPHPALLSYHCAQPGAFRQAQACTDKLTATERMECGSCFRTVNRVETQRYGVPDGCVVDKKLVDQFVSNSRHLPSLPRSRA